MTGTTQALQPKKSKAEQQNNAAEQDSPVIHHPQGAGTNRSAGQQISRGRS